MKNWKNGQSRERNPMREALQSSRLPLYLKNKYIYGPRVKWARNLVKNIKFRFFLASAAFLVATKLSCRDTGRRCRDILLLVATLVVDVATYCCLSRHWSSMSRHTAACRDIGRDVATYCCLSRHTFPCRDILS